MKARMTAAGEPVHPGGETVGAVLAMRSMGTKNEQAAQWLLNALINAAVPGGDNQPLSDQELNGALSMLQEIAPRDEIEAMLVSQMVTVHTLISTQARRLRSAETIPQLAAPGAILTKLQRTVTAQLEALQRYRGKAPQQVRVEHVHVHDGGRAIVGAVHPGGVGCRANLRINPMQKRLPMHQGKLCRAKSKRSGPDA
jgi:hypothetical protein